MVLSTKAAHITSVPTLSTRNVTLLIFSYYIPSGAPTKSFFPLRKDEGSHLVIMNCNVLVGFKVAHDRTGENLPMFD